MASRTTVPEGRPPRLTLSEPICRVNCALTATAEDMVTEHVLVPLQPPPLQPANTDPDAADAVKVTLLPAVKLALQVTPQLMPAGLLVTVPVPVPTVETVSVCAAD